MTGTRNALSIKGRQLLCDVPSCGYFEDIEELLESMIEKPCPRCGASLLTREDYEAAERMMKTIHVVQSRLGEIEDGQPTVTQHIDLNPRASDLKVTIKDFDF